MLKLAAVGELYHTQGTDNVRHLAYRFRGADWSRMTDKLTARSKKEVTYVIAR